MKKLSVLTSLFTLALITSCSSGESSVTSEAQQKEFVQEFVAVTSDEWDAKTTLGSFVYTLHLDLKNDRTVNFAATCVGKAQTQNQGGGGFPGGFPGMGGDEQSSTEQSSEAPFTSADAAEHSFSYTGSYEEVVGYGYTITMNDVAKSVIHTDYSKIEGRHEFHYLVSDKEGNKSTVHFQSKDSSYRSKLAADYKTWDERDSRYIFTAQARGNNNSVDYAYLYLHSDGSVVMNAPKNAARDVTLGATWQSVDNTLAIQNGESTSKAVASINKDKPGYRLAYQSYSFFCNTKDATAWNTFTNDDFDGKTLYQFTGSYETSSFFGTSTTYVVMNLTDTNNAFIYTGDQADATNNLAKGGTYTYDKSTKKFTIDFGKPVEVAPVDGTYTFTTTITVTTQQGPMTSTSDHEVTLTYTAEK